MEYNKSQVKKENDKKILHKVRKHWVVVSLAVLGAIGATGLSKTGVHASNQINTNHSNLNVTKLRPQVSQSNLVKTNPNPDQVLRQRLLRSARQDQPFTLHVNRQANHINYQIIGHAGQTPTQHKTTMQGRAQSNSLAAGQASRRRSQSSVTSVSSVSTGMSQTSQAASRAESIRNRRELQSADLVKVGAVAHPEARLLKDGEYDYSSADNSLMGQIANYSNEIADQNVTATVQQYHSEMNSDSNLAQAQLSRYDNVEGLSGVNSAAAESDNQRIQSDIASAVKSNGSVVAASVSATFANSAANQYDDRIFDQTTAKKYYDNVSSLANEMSDAASTINNASGNVIGLVQDVSQNTKQIQKIFTSVSAQAASIGAAIGADATGLDAFAPADQSPYATSYPVVDISLPAGYSMQDYLNNKNNVKYKLECNFGDALMNGKIHKINVLVPNLDLWNISVNGGEMGRQAFSNHGGPLTTTGANWNVAPISYTISQGDNANEVTIPSRNLSLNGLTDQGSRNTVDFASINMNMSGNALTPGVRSGFGSSGPGMTGNGCGAENGFTWSVNNLNMYGSNYYGSTSMHDGGAINKSQMVFNNIDYVGSELAYNLCNGNGASIHFRGKDNVQSGLAYVPNVVSGAHYDFYHGGLSCTPDDRDDSAPLYASPRGWDSGRIAYIDDLQPAQTYVGDNNDPSKKFNMLDDTNDQQLGESDHNIIFDAGCKFTGATTNGTCIALDAGGTITIAPDAQVTLIPRGKDSEGDWAGPWASIEPAGVSLDNGQGKLDIQPGASLNIYPDCDTMPYIWATTSGLAGLNQAPQGIWMNNTSGSLGSQIVVGNGSSLNVDYRRFYKSNKNYPLPTYGSTSGTGTNPTNGAPFSVHGSSTVTVQPHGSIYVNGGDPANGPAASLVYVCGGSSFKLNPESKVQLLSGGSQQTTLFNAIGGSYISLNNPHLFQLSLNGYNNPAVVNGQIVNTGNQYDHQNAFVNTNPQSTLASNSVGINASDVELHDQDGKSYDQYTQVIFPGGNTTLEGNASSMPGYSNIMTEVSNETSRLGLGSFTSQIQSAIKAVLPYGQSNLYDRNNLTLQNDFDNAIDIDKTIDAIVHSIDAGAVSEPTLDPGEKQFNYDGNTLILNNNNNLQQKFASFVAAAANGLSDSTRAKINGFQPAGTESPFDLQHGFSFTGVQKSMVEGMHVQKQGDHYVVSGYAPLGSYIRLDDDDISSNDNNSERSTLPASGGLSDGDYDPSDNYNDYAAIANQSVGHGLGYWSYQLPDSYDKQSLDDIRRDLVATAHTETVLSKDSSRRVNDYDNGWQTADNNDHDPAAYDAERANIPTDVDDDQLEPGHNFDTDDTNAGQDFEAGRIKGRQDINNLVFDRSIYAEPEPFIIGYLTAQGISYDPKKFNDDIKADLQAINRIRSYIMTDYLPLINTDSQETQSNLTAIDRTIHELDSLVAGSPQQFDPYNNLQSLAYGDLQSAVYRVNASQVSFASAFSGLNVSLNAGLNGVASGLNGYETSGSSSAISVQSSQVADIDDQLGDLINTLLQYEDDVDTDATRYSHYYHLAQQAANENDVVNKELNLDTANAVYDVANNEVSDADHDSSVANTDESSASVDNSYASSDSNQVASGVKGIRTPTSDSEALDFSSVADSYSSSADWDSDEAQRALDELERKDDYMDHTDNYNNVVSSDSSEITSLQSSLSNDSASLSSALGAMGSGAEKDSYEKYSADVSETQASLSSLATDLSNQSAVYQKNSSQLQSDLSQASADLNDIIYSRRPKLNLYNNVTSAVNVQQSQDVDKSLFDSAEGLNLGVLNHTLDSADDTEGRNDVGSYKYDLDGTLHGALHDWHDAKHLRYRLMSIKATLTRLVSALNLGAVMPKIPAAPQPARHANVPSASSASGTAASDQLRSAGRHATSQQSGSGTPERPSVSASSTAASSAASARPVQPQSQQPNHDVVPGADPVKPAARQSNHDVTPAQPGTPQSRQSNSDATPQRSNQSASGGRSASPAEPSAGQSSGSNQTASSDDNMSNNNVNNAQSASQSAASATPQPAPSVHSAKDGQSSTPATPVQHDSAPSLTITVIKKDGTSQPKYSSRVINVNQPAGSTFTIDPQTYLPAGYHAAARDHVIDDQVTSDGQLSQDSVAFTYVANAKPTSGSASASTSHRAASQSNSNADQSASSADPVQQRGLITIDYVNDGKVVSAEPVYGLVGDDFTVSEHDGQIPSGYEFDSIVSNQVHHFENQPQTIEIEVSPVIRSAVAESANASGASAADLTSFASSSISHPGQVPSGVDSTAPAQGDQSESTSFSNAASNRDLASSVGSTETSSTGSDSASNDADPASADDQDSATADSQDTADPSSNDTKKRKIPNSDYVAGARDAYLRRSAKRNNADYASGYHDMINQQSGKLPQTGEHQSFKLALAMLIINSTLLGQMVDDRRRHDE